MTAALLLRGLGKDYGSRTAVAAIDLEVQRGECLGLLGPNGAGKTTTISMACGVLTPTRGEVEIGGVSLARDPFAAKAKLGLVPQELAIYEDLTATQNLRYLGALYGIRGTLLGDRIAIIDHGAIVATGTVRELVERHASKRLAIELRGDEAAVAAAIERARAHADIERIAGSTRITAEPRGELAPVLAALESGGVSVARIESHGADLEAAFLALTGHALRDAS